MYVHIHSTAFWIIFPVSTWHEMPVGTSLVNTQLSQQPDHNDKKLSAQDVQPNSNLICKKNLILLGYYPKSFYGNHYQCIILIV